jgi:DNA recombination protein RmuC
MEITNLDVVLLAGGIAAGLVIAAVVWLMARRPRRKEVRELRETLQAEIERRAAAEAKLLEIPKLETLLKSNERAIANFNDERKLLGEQVAKLEADLANEQNNAAEKLAMLNDAQKKLTDAFNALAAKALSSNNESFLKLAKENLSAIQESAKGELETRKQAIDALVKPLKESLENVDKKIQELETKREGAYATLTEQIKSLGMTQDKLQSETGNLVKALRAPQVRGRWGEMQLRRLIEMAGMLDHCDFIEQDSTATEEGRLRPDVKVFLPNGRLVIIDSKVPLLAYLEAVDATDDAERALKLRDHARQLRTHLNQLSSKAYWKQFENTPDFVVMFLPLESAFSAALIHDPALIEESVSQGVIMATPTTLLALLKAVAYGWSHERITQNAREIRNRGQELYERITKFVEHFARVGSSLDGALRSYNAASGSLESRVLVTARKFSDLGLGDGVEIPEVRQLEAAPRLLKADEPASAPVSPNGE